MLVLQFAKWRSLKLKSAVYNVNLPFVDLLRDTFVGKERGPTKRLEIEPISLPAQSFHPGPTRACMYNVGPKA